MNVIKFNVLNLLLWLNGWAGRKKDLESRSPYYRVQPCRASCLDTCSSVTKQYNLFMCHFYCLHYCILNETRSSADADNRLDAFSGQSRSTNMVPFHVLHIVSYCAIVTLSLRRAVFPIFVFKKFHDLEMGVKGHSRSLRVVSFDRLCMVSY